MQLRKYLIRALFPAVIAGGALPSLAGNIYVNPGDDIAGRITSAHAGDTVHLGSGTFQVGSTIVVPSGVTLTGVSPSQTHVIFNLSGDDTNSYGLSIAGNAHDTTIEQIDFVSNHGVIQMSLGDPYTDSFNNIVIRDNSFQYGGGQLSDGTFVFGIFGSMPNNGLQIIYNYFHDSTEVGTRNWCIWNANDSNLDYNVFYNIQDGGQISSPRQNVSFSHNYGTLIHRMGQEAGLVQGSSLTFDGNVFYDWVNPYPDSDALSVVGPSGQVDYTNNYFRASIAPGSSWGPSDGSGLNRFGLAIEGTGEPANVSGNTFVGTWACCYSSTMPNAVCSDNIVYGGALWGNFDGEPGPYGMGGCIESGTQVHNMNAAPNPPANTFAGPQNDGSQNSGSQNSNSQGSSSENSGSQNGNSQNNGSQSNGSQSGGQSSSSSNSSSNSSSSQQQSTNQQASGQPSSNQQSSGGQSSGGQSSSGQSASKQSSGQQSSSQTPSNQQPAAQQGSAQQATNPQSGGGQPGTSQSGHGNSSGSSQGANAQPANSQAGNTQAVSSPSTGGNQASSTSPAAASTASAAPASPASTPPAASPVSATATPSAQATPRTAATGETPPAKVATAVPAPLNPSYVSTWEALDRERRHKHDEQLRAERVKQQQEQASAPQN